MDDTEARLTDWGMWAGGYGRGGTVPNILGRLIANGGIRCSTPDNWSHLPPEIEQTERAIAQLKLHSKYLKTLVFQRYLYKFQPEEIATNLDRPKDDILRGLDRARDWIGDWIDSQEEISRNLDRLAISNR